MPLYSHLHANNLIKIDKPEKLHFHEKQNFNEKQHFPSQTFSKANSVITSDSYETETRTFQAPPALAAAQRRVKVLKVMTRVLHENRN